MAQRRARTKVREAEETDLAAFARANWENPLFPRIFRLRDAASAIASESFGRLGLGVKQGFLLRFLSDGVGVSPSAFAKLTDTDSAAVVRLVDSLEKRGLVLRRDDPRDRRRWTLSLTPTGQQLAVEVARAQKDLQRRLAGALTEREMNTLLALLDKAIAALDVK